MDFLRFEKNVTKYEEVKAFVGDDTFSVVTFQLFGDLASYDVFIRHEVTVDGVKCNLYKNTCFGSISLREDGSGSAGVGGICGAVGPGIPSGKDIPAEDKKVFDFLDNPERLQDFCRVFAKLRNIESVPMIQVYLVKAFMPTPFPGAILDDAVAAAKRWAKKVPRAR